MDINLDRAKQHEIRSHLLKCLDRQRPDPLSEALVLRSLHQHGIMATRQEMVQELAYLKGKELVGQTEILWRLLPLGVDLLEHNCPDIPGVPVNGILGPDSLTFRQEIRGRLLMALYIARPHGATASLLWQTLEDCDLQLSQKELTREAVYLEGKGLITINGKINSDVWRGVLTVAGQDVMEYTIPVPPGIHLIDKYWEE